MWFFGAFGPGVSAGASHGGLFTGAAINRIPVRSDLIVCVKVININIPAVVCVRCSDLLLILESRIRSTT